ncbi:Bug family tripartite tricarboxylate transporter substrate binding protein [Craurococcus roseus]
MRRTLLATAFAVGASLPVSRQAAAQQVQVVVPFPAGSGGDTVARIVQPALAEELGASGLVRNVAGAAEVTRAKPDGTTLLLTSMSTVVIQPSVPYRVGSFAPVCLVADVATRARAEPGKLPFATGGIGGLGHLAMTALTRAASIEKNHTPLRGSGDGVATMQQGSVSRLAAEVNLEHQYGFTQPRCSPKSGCHKTRARPPCASKGTTWPSRYGPGSTPRPARRTRCWTSWTGRAAASSTHAP